MGDQMSNPINFNPLNPLGPLQPAGPSAAKAAQSADSGNNFGDALASALREHLGRVNTLQSEADQTAKQLATGQSESVIDAFTAARKAEIAFSMLMEVRNKLVDAYQELQNLRV